MRRILIDGELVSGVSLMVGNKSEFTLPLTSERVVEVMREIGVDVPALLPADAERLRGYSERTLGELGVEALSDPEWLIDGWLPKAGVGMLGGFESQSVFRLFQQSAYALSRCRSPLLGMERSFERPLGVLYVDYSPVDYVAREGYYLQKLYGAFADEGYARCRGMAFLPYCPMFGHHDLERSFSLVPETTVHGNLVYQVAESMLKTRGLDIIMIEGAGCAYGSDPGLEVYVRMFLDKLMAFARSHGVTVLLCEGKSYDAFAVGGIWEQSLDFFIDLRRADSAEGKRDEEDESDEDYEFVEFAMEAEALLFCVKQVGGVKVSPMRLVRSEERGFWVAVDGGS